MKKLTSFLKSIVPSRSRWRRWSMPTKASYLFIVFSILGYFVNLWVDLQNKNDNATEIRSGDIIILPEENLEVFDVNFTGRLKNLEINIDDVIRKELKRNLVINIDYSGHYRNLTQGSDISRYSGGNVVIKVESCVLNFSELKIAPLGPAPQNILLGEVKDRYLKILQTHKLIVKQRITKCIEGLL